MSPGITLPHDRSSVPLGKHCSYPPRYAGLWKCQGNNVVDKLRLVRLANT